MSRTLLCSVHGAILDHLELEFRGADVFHKTEEGLCPDPLTWVQPATEEVQESVAPLLKDAELTKSVIDYEPLYARRINTRRVPETPPSAQPEEALKIWKFSHHGNGKALEMPLGPLIPMRTEEIDYIICKHHITVAMLIEAMMLLRTFDTHRSVAQFLSKLSPGSYATELVIDDMNGVTVRRFGLPLKEPSEG